MFSIWEMRNLPSVHSLENDKGQSKQSRSLGTIYLLLIQKVFSKQSSLIKCYGTGFG